jgi:ABC-2 type transport system ATP-binding protein
MDWREVSAVEPAQTGRVVLDSVYKTFYKAGLFFRRRSNEETQALKGVSFDIFGGEVFGLLGPNGSGKSTTLKLISTVLLPDAGRVLVDGGDTQSKTLAVRKQVGLALASERSFFPRLTARENLEFFAAFEDVPRRETRARVGFVIEQAGLMGVDTKQVMKFSSGMIQRLGIARALIKQPSVLLLDEPSRSLDPAAATRLWQLIRNLSGNGMTILLATHNFEEAATACDRIAVLQSGEVLAIRKLSHWSAGALREFYLDITGEELKRAWQEQEGVPA